MRERRAARVRTLLGFLAFALLLLLVGVVFKLSDREVQNILERQRAERYTLQLETPEMKGFNVEGEKVWDIQAESVTVDEARDLVTFVNTTANFYDKGEPSLTAKVGKLEYHRGSRNMEMSDGLQMRTADDVDVVTTRVIWYDYYQRFVFPEGAKLLTEEGNYIQTDYMQSDKKLDHIEAVGHVFLWVQKLEDQKLFEKHDLVKQELKLEDFKRVTMTAEKLLYDRKGQIILATSRFHDKPFRVVAPDGKEVRIEDYEPDPRQLFFKRKEVEVFANHIEVHIDAEWVKAMGSVKGTILPSEPGAKDDKALKVMKRERTWFTTEDVEYYWKDDYVRTFAPTTIVQDGRLMEADKAVYFGYYRQTGMPGTQRALFIEGGVRMWQKSGKWMFDEGLLDAVKEQELKKIFQEESDISGDRMVVFLNRNDFHAAGNVRVKQENRRVRCDEVLYTDSEKKFIANGNAYFVDKENQEFYGQQIIYYSDAEDIEVNGAGTVTIKIPPKYLEDIDQALKRIKGEKNEKPREEPATGGSPETPESSAGRGRAVVVKSGK
jgi:hypothetical protein